MESDGSDDEDYSYTGYAHSLEKRYPIHDACEFDDIEVLRRLIVEPIPDDEAGQSGTDDGDESSSDENDSTAAAHAAATGHTPLPRRPDVGSSQDKAQDGAAAAAAAASDGETADGAANSAAQQSGEEATAQEPGEKSGGAAPLSIDVATSVQGKSEENPASPGDPKTPRASNATLKSDQPETAEAAGADGKGQDEAKSVPMDIEQPAEKTNDKESDLSAGEAEKSQSEPRRKKEVRYRVPQGVSLNEKDEDENTALHVAIHSRKMEHVKLLLEMGASFRLKCDGSFAIHTAISMGSVRAHQQFAYECVVALHDAGADLTIKDDSNHSPLYLACMFNLPQIVSYILSDEDGLSTLNLRADRAGNRCLHAAAKFDTLTNPSTGKNGGSSAPSHHHHPDGSIVTPKTIPGFPGKVAANQEAPAGDSSTAALLTQVLLGTSGIEVDGINSIGQTALHVACARGNWPVVRLLLQAESDPNIADRRGFTPGQVAYKRGMPIPADLLASLGDPPESGTIPPPRDLIVDPNAQTAIITHELCGLHRTCPPIRRDSAEPPPENVRRLHVLTDRDTGILRAGEFAPCSWKHEARRAAMADVLKVHEYTYVESISNVTASIPDHPGPIAHLDPDTTVSRWSFEAALRAAGSVCQAVDLVLSGEFRNAFCATRPPGHHAGPRGMVKGPNDPDGGSHGFCLLNNVAIGAAYARSMYRNDGIRKVAIIDFDVHHGNGTEEIVRQLVPVTEKVAVRTPFAFGELSSSSYRPWLDETDIHNVLFASTHGYGNRGFDNRGWFYPASGKTHTSESITHPGMVETPNQSDFLSSETWSRMGEESRSNCSKIINVGLELPEMTSDPQGRSMKQRLDLRDVYRTKILPQLREFDPDLIFISAGFDAHRKDTMNFGYVGMVEEDFEWVTEQLIKVANTCCNGRVVSVLEGGYRIHGGIVSPFARSVASHVRALVDGGKSRELFDPKDNEWESQYERHIYEKRERKKEEDKERLRLRMEAIHRTSMLEQQMVEAGEAPPEDPDAPSRKRRRNQVDYKELYKQLQQEGFAS